MYRRRPQMVLLRLPIHHQTPRPAPIRRAGVAPGLQVSDSIRACRQLWAWRAFNGRDSLCRPIRACPGEWRQSCSTIIREWRDPIRSEGDPSRDRSYLSRLSSDNYGYEEDDTCREVSQCLSGRLRSTAQGGAPQGGDHVRGRAYKKPSWGEPLRSCEWNGISCASMTVMYRFATVDMKTSPKVIFRINVMKSRPLSSLVRRWF